MDDGLHGSIKWFGWCIRREHMKDATGAIATPRSTIYATETCKVGILGRWCPVVHSLNAAQSNESTFKLSIECNYVCRKKKNIWHIWIALALACPPPATIALVNSVNISHLILCVLVTRILHFFLRTLNLEMVFMCLRWVFAAKNAVANFSAQIKMHLKARFVVCKRRAIFFFVHFAYFICPSKYTCNVLGALTGLCDWLASFYIYTIVKRQNSHRMKMHQLKIFKKWVWRFNQPLSYAGFSLFSPELFASNGCTIWSDCDAMNSNSSCFRREKKYAMRRSSIFFVLFVLFAHEIQNCMWISAWKTWPLLDQFTYCRLKFNFKVFHFP